MEAEIEKLTAKLAWMRWGLEEIGRCSEPRAGNNEPLYFRIVNEALTGAGVGVGEAGIQKPNAPAPR